MPAAAPVTMQTLSLSFTGCHHMMPGDAMRALLSHRRSLTVREQHAAYYSFTGRPVSPDSRAFSTISQTRKMSASESDCVFPP